MREGTGEPGGDAPQQVDVWPCTRLPVEVFDHCQIEVVGAGMGIWWNGVSSREVESACRLLRVPTPERAELLDDVRYMGRAVSAAVNKRLQKG